MNASIEEIKAYMDNLNKKSCFNRSTGTCRDIKNSKDKMNSSEILIPKIKDNDDMIISYIQQLDDENIKNKFTKKKIRNNGGLDVYFHREITDEGLYDDWWKYRENKIGILAKKWCKENDIPYTD